VDAATRRPRGDGNFFYYLQQRCCGLKRTQAAASTWVMSDLNNRVGSAFPKGRKERRLARLGSSGARCAFQKYRSPANVHFHTGALIHHTSAETKSSARRSDPGLILKLYLRHKSIPISNHPAPKNPSSTGFGHLPRPRCSIAAREPLRSVQAALLGQRQPFDHANLQSRYGRAVFEKSLTRRRAIILPAPRKATSTFAFAREDRAVCRQRWLRIFGSSCNRGSQFSGMAESDSPFAQAQRRDFCNVACGLFHSALRGAQPLFPTGSNVSKRAPKNVCPGGSSDEDFAEFGVRVRENPARVPQKRREQP